MRRLFATVGVAVYLLIPGSASAGPGSASGPITVDSTTFVPGSSVMGTDGGVYGDNIPPVTSTTTAAFRMTKYRAEHVNLRNSSGVEIGTVGNPLNVTGGTTVTLTTVTVTNSSFSVTGSTVNIQGTVPVSIAGTVNVALPSTSVSGSTVNIQGTVPVTLSGSPTVTIGSQPISVTGSTVAVNIQNAIPAGTNQIGLVSGSSVTVSNINRNVSGSTVTIVTSGGNDLPVSGTLTVNPGSTAFPIISTNTLAVAPAAGKSFPIISTTTLNVAGTVTVGNASLPVSLASTSVSGSTVTISNSNLNVSVTNTPSVNVVNVPTTTISGSLPAGTNQLGTVSGSTVSISGTASVSVSNSPNVSVVNTPAVTISNQPTVTVAQSSFSVTGSTVNINGTVNAVFSGTANTYVTNVPTVTISGTPTVNAVQSGNWNTLTQVIDDLGNRTSVGYSGGAITMPITVSDGSLLAGVTNVAGSKGLNVNIIGGAGAGGTSSDFESSYPSAGTAAGFVGPTGLMQGARVDISSNVYVNVANTALSVTGSTVSISGTVAISSAIPFNVSGSTVVISGTPNVNVSNTPNVSVTNTPNVSVTNTVGTTLTAQLPAGTNNIGTVSGSTVTVSGAIAATIAGTVDTYVTNPTTTTISNSPTVYLATTSVSGSTVTIVNPTGGSLAVSGTFWQAAQPIISTNTLTISGTVTANAGTGNFSTTGSTVTILNTAGGTLAVSGTVAATQSGTWTTNSTVISTNTLNVAPASGQAFPVISTTTISVAPTSGQAFPVISTTTLNVSAAQSGTWTSTVNQGTNRWNVNFSTTTTTAVLSSTGVTTNVAISTPVAGVSSQTVRIFRLMLTADAATTITFRDGSTQFGDSQYLAANGSIVLDLTNEPWYITSATNGFVVQQSGTAHLGMRIWYTQS